MPPLPSSPSPVPSWVLNYLCLVGGSTLGATVVASAMGAPVPWQAFVGATGLSAISLQCASGRQLMRDLATLVRAFRGRK